MMYKNKDGTHKILRAKQSVHYNITIVVFIILTLVGLTWTGDAVASWTNTRVSDDSNTQGNVVNYTLSKDDKYVVYVSDERTPGVFELISMNLETNSKVFLSGAIGLNGDVYDFKISEDNSYVIYRSDKGTDDKYELYSVDISGGVNSKLNIDIGLGVSNGVRDFRLSKNSDFVVYRVRNPLTNIVTLFKVDISGGASQLISGSQPVGSNYEIVANDATVILQGTDSHIFTIPLNNINGITQITPNLEGNDEYTSGFRVSPDSLYVAYLFDGRTDSLFTDEYDLMVLPLSGGTPIRMNTINDAPISLSSPVGDRGLGYEFTSDSTRVLYITERPAPGTLGELRSNLVGGNSEVVLSKSSDGSLQVLPFLFKISPDGSYVLIFGRYSGASGFPELFASPVSQQNLRRVSHPESTPSVSGVDNPELLPDSFGLKVNYVNVGISPDSKFVYYEATDWWVRGDGTPDTRDHLFVYNNDTKSVEWLNSNIPDTSNQQGGNDLDRVYISKQDSNFLFHLSDYVENNKQEIYRVPIEGGEHEKVNVNFSSGVSKLGGVSVLNDSESVLYIVDSTNYISSTIPGYVNTNISLNDFNFSGDIYFSSVSGPSDPEPDSGEICFPIKDKADSLSIICL